MKLTKLFSIFVILLLAAIPVLAENPVVEDQIAIRHANLDQMHYGLSMLGEGFVAYIAQIGGDTTKLQSILDDFNAKRDPLLNANTHAEINVHMDQARILIESFIAEYNTQITAKNGKPAEGLIKAFDNLNQHKDEYDAKIDNYWSVRKEKSIEIYDTQLSQAQEFVDWFKTQGYDTTKLQQILDSIDAKQPELIAAIDERNEIKIQGTLADIAIKVQALGTEADRLLKQGK